MNANSVSLAQTEGRALYHKIWQTLRTNFWDPKRISWDSWEFDDTIDSIDSAKRRAAQLIRALNDKYTKLLENEPKTAAEGDNETSAELVLDVVYSTVLDQNIGYLCISTFSKSNVFEQVQKALLEIKDCDGFIIDLRGNGGGYVNPAARCLEFFIEKGQIATIEQQVADGVQTNKVYFDADTFYRLTTRPDGSEKEVEAHRAECVTKDKPIVLLLDDGSASASELFAGALLDNGKEDGRVIAIGSRTFGKGIIQNTIEFDECSLKFTSGRYLSPTDEWFGDGAQTVANGIHPTIAVSTREFKLPVRKAFLHLCEKLGKVLPAPKPRQTSPALSGLALGATALLFTIGIAALSRQRN